MRGDDFGICALCDREEKLERSHIVPAFVFRWLKSTGGTDYLRKGAEPNRRVQDGDKGSLLCRDCEQKFSILEKWHNERVFSICTSNSHPVGRYTSEYSRFVASIIWRVALFQKVRGVHKDLPVEERERINVAMQVWKDFLNKRLPHPREYELHAIPIGGLHDISHKNVPSNWNRYTQRLVEMDYVFGERHNFEAFYCKMGPVAYFGFVRNKGQKWKGSRLAVNDGIFVPEKLVLPPFLLDFFFERARGSDSISRSVSDRQKGISEAEVFKNIERFSRSAHFDAIKADAERFGIDAVSYKSKT